MSVLNISTASDVASAVDAVVEEWSGQQQLTDLDACLTDRCGARRVGWLCVVGLRVSDFALPHCNSGHYTLRYTTHHAFEGDAR